MHDVTGEKQRKAKNDHLVDIAQEIHVLSLSNSCHGQILLPERSVAENSIRRTILCP